MAKTETSNYHHYVPLWYQRRFLPTEGGEFSVFDKNPVTGLFCPDGVVRSQKPREVFRHGPRKLFRQEGFYSVALRGVPDDAIERLIYGPIDNSGARANHLFNSWPESHGILGAEVAAQIPMRFGHPSERMADLVEYLNAQKMRTPRGIDQIKAELARAGAIGAGKNLEMGLLMSRRQGNCTVWAECFWEIFSIEDGETRFLLSDDPVVLYNMDCYPGSPNCRYPNDPHPFWRGTRVIHPLSQNRLLVLSHIEHVDEPSRKKACRNRIHARSHDQVMITYTDIQSDRKLSSNAVATVNFVVKVRAIRYVASTNPDDLYPERIVRRPKWADIDALFHQPYPTHLSKSETYIKYKDDSILFTDAHGRRDFVPGWFVKQSEKKK